MFIYLIYLIKIQLEDKRNSCARDCNSAEQAKMISLPKKIWFVDRFCVWEYKPFQLSKDGFLLCIVATELFGFVTGAGMTLELMGELGDEMDHKMFGGVGRLSWKS